MKATIRELWQTGREIISFDNSEFDRPTRISDLKVCKNVLIGEREHGYYNVMIDNNIYQVKPNKARGFGGTIMFLEIL